MIAAVLLVLDFMLSPTATIAGDLLLYQFCGISSNNNTANSTYLGNLELLSHMLVKNTSANPSPFAKGSISAVSDTSYCLFLCRGDVGAFDCSQCATIGFQDAQRLWGFNKEATIFYDQCLIRFSNKDFLDHVSRLGRDHTVVGPRTSDALPGLDPNRPNSVSFINDIIKVLLQETAKRAAYNSTWRFATGRMEVNGNFAPLYSLMQCLPDLTATECLECLKNISEMAMRLQGSQVLAVPCNLRYSMVQFYESRPMWRIKPSADAVVPPDVMPTNQKHKSSGP